MGSARRRRKRALEQQVRGEQSMWDGFFWFTDRVSKRTGQPIPRITTYGGRLLYDHRDDPMKLSLEDRIRRTARSFWIGRED
jgi:hypothetical protein